MENLQRNTSFNLQETQCRPSTENNSINLHQKPKANSIRRLQATHSPKLQSIPKHNAGITTNRVGLIEIS